MLEHHEGDHDVGGQVRHLHPVLLKNLHEELGEGRNQTRHHEVDAGHELANVLPRHHLGGNRPDGMVFGIPFVPDDERFDSRQGLSGLEDKPRQVELSVGARMARWRGILLTGTPGWRLRTATPPTGVTWLGSGAEPHGGRAGAWPP